MHNKLLCLLTSCALFVLLAPNWPASAQFLPGSALPGTDDPMYALAVFDDGTGPALYATGDVFRGDGEFLNSLGKWDGTSWHPVGGGLGDPTSDHSWYGRSMVVHDDGSGEELCVGGVFTEVAGETAGHVACWNGQAWDTLGGGVPFAVRHLASFDDGSGPALYAAGNGFGSYITRWNGDTWETLSGSEGATSLSGVMVPFDDGNGEKLYAAGFFQTASGETDAIAVWDGSQWNPVQGPVGPDGVQSGYILSMATFDDGSGEKLYVGGTFRSAGGIPSRNIAAWTGSQWQAVPSPLVEDEIAALTVYDDGNGPRLIAGINVMNDDSLVVAWDGQNWTELDSPGRLAEGPIEDFAVFDEPLTVGGTASHLFAVGSFRRSGNPNRVLNVGRWDGQAWTGVAQRNLLGLDYPGQDFAAYDEGKGPSLFIGGQFITAGNAYAKSVARYQGTSFSALRDPLGEALVLPETEDNTEVYAMQVFDDGNGPRLYVGGDFFRHGQNPLSRLAAWDGTTWHGVANSVSDEIYAMAVFDDGNGEALYLGGHFHEINNSAYSRIVRWDGETFSAVRDLDGSDGLDRTVWDMEVFDDGSGPALYVVGPFNTAGSTPADGLARWHPDDGWTSVGGFTSPTNQSPSLLEVFDDGSGPALYIAGGLSTVNGITTNGVVKWDGVTFTPLAGPAGIGLTFNGETSRAIALEAYDAGGGERLYVGGGFDAAGGIAAENIASWAGERWRSLIGSGRVIHNVPRTNGATWVSSLFGFEDNGVPTLFISGMFSEIGGHTSYYFSRYVEMESVFVDGFESGNVSAWSNASGTP